VPTTTYHSLADQPFVPVIVGAHVGGYSLVRAFHEAYGVRSLVVTGATSWVVENSAILEVVHCHDAHDPDVLTATLQGAPFAGLTAPKIVLATSDPLVDVLVAMRDRVDDTFRVPYVGPGPLEAATRKHTFAEVAQRAGVTIPTTTVIRMGDADYASRVPSSGYPLVLKATAPRAWNAVSFEGHAKVHEVTGEAELRDLLDRIHAAGYRDELVVQDRIPGDDTGMRILTCYCDRESRVRFASYGRTLIEEHSPGLLGVPAAILTGRDRPIVDEAVRLLGELKWVGYANFDLKFDPRDGHTKFFELNPRLGRSNYYVTGTGFNPVTWYVEEYVHDRLPEEFELVEADTETVYSVVPVRTIKWALSRHPELWAQVRRVIKAGGLRNPLHYKAERDPRRWARILAAGLSYDRKFHRYYDPDAAFHPGADAAASTGRPADLPPRPGPGEARAS
jgi:D-aspartate ligase